MEENTLKLIEKVKELIALGKKKKSILELQEINDFFSDMELDSEQMDKVFEALEASNIDVLRIGEGDEDDDDIEIMLTEEMRWIWRKSTSQCRMESALKIRSGCI